MNVLVTGANGFLGGHLCWALNSNPRIRLTACVRKGQPTVVVDSVTQIPTIDSETVWNDALKAQDVVVHTAARAHIMRDEVEDPLAEYRKVNVYGTLNLARQAALTGIKRFIFISSIKVNGEHTVPDRSFFPEDTPNPEDPYGISKYEAECGLQKLSAETGMEVVIIRPPLVYGRGVKGNFDDMTKLVAKGIPLPLGAVRNKRSLVSVDNLVDLIIVCIEHPAAANQVFLASDGVDLSTTQLLRGVAKAMSVQARLISIPNFFLMFMASLFGKRAVAQRLLGSLQIDISKARDLLGWQPPLSVEEGLRRCFETEVK